MQQSCLIKCDIFQISIPFSKVLKAALQILWVYYFGKGRQYVQIRNIANILYFYKVSEGNVPEFLEIRISKIYHHSIYSSEVENWIHTTKIITEKIFVFKLQLHYLPCYN